MSLNDLVALLVGSLLLLVVSLAAGPKLGVGLVLGVALVAMIFRTPIVGLGLMILAGTSLQVLGSEHIIGLPLSLGKIAGAATFAAWALRVAVIREPLTYSPQILALLAFAVAMVVTAALSPDKPLAQEGLFRYAQLFLLYFMLISQAGLSSRTLDQCCIILTACMVLSVFIGISEFFLPSLALESDDPSLEQGAIGAILDHDSVDGVEIKRITGGLSDSNWFAYTLAGVLPLNLYLFHCSRTSLNRTLVLAAAALQSFGIVLSLTRTALFAVGIAVLILLWKRRLPLAPILAATLAASIAVLVWNPPGMQRLFSVQYLQQGSTPLREYLLKGGIQLIRDQPLRGYGYSEFGPNFFRWLSNTEVPEAVEIWEKDLRDKDAAGTDRLEYVMPHNTVLQIWVEYGAFGFAAFALFLVCALRDLAFCGRHPVPRIRLLADCLTAATWGFFVCALFGHLAMLKIIWILTGLAAALRRVAYPRTQPSPAPPGAEALPQPGEAQS